eukprot:XP_011666241.1 PREDICTED: ficolin-2-like [Strongylocentrotus purpuratus]
MAYILEESEDRSTSYCDMDTAAWCWTVFQRRKDGSVSFSGNWLHYKKGFGSVSGEHWLGNDKIHRLTSQKTYELWVDIEDFSGRTSHARYRKFMIGNETMNYDLKLGDYSGGGAGDSLAAHRGCQFSTRDRDNDASMLNCAGYYLSGWWFSECRICDLNGIYQYLDVSVLATNRYYMVWNPMKFLKGSEMKIRPLTMGD